MAICYKLVLALAIRIRTHIGHIALFRNTDFLYLLIDKQTRRDELAKAKKDRGRRILGSQEEKSF